MQGFQSAEGAMLDTVFLGEILFQHFYDGSKHKDLTSKF
jgi:hypothetical protein